jgi:hypothetical protein
VHAVIAVATSAGHWVDEKVQSQWEERPDLAFVLDRLAATVVRELLQTMTLEFCKTAEQSGLRLLPPYSPGYKGWDLADQHTLLALIRGSGRGPSPDELSLLHSGMIQPKNAQLSLFALSHDVVGKRPRDFHPCHSCDLRGCQFRQKEPSEVSSWTS